MSEDRKFMAQMPPLGKAPEGESGAGRNAEHPDRQPRKLPDGEGTQEMRQQIIDVLRTCYDPEIPVDIYELGLIYKVDVDEHGNAAVLMTLTSPMCPVAGSLPPEIEAKVAALEGVSSASIELVWDPPWHPGLMSEAARLDLNMF